MRILFLDDDHDRHKRYRFGNIGRDVTYVFDYEECCKALLELPRFDLADLDHDLSDRQAAGFDCPDEKNGTDVARFIAELPEDKRPHRVVLHSFMRDKAMRQARILHAVRIDCVYEKFNYPPAL